METGIILSNIQAMMTGVYRIGQNKHKVTLYYTDGTTETGDYKNPITPEVNVFEVVGTIQSQRSE